jgi:hypothetical protein
MKFGIVVGGESKRCQTIFLHRDAQFLAQLAYECLFRPLARLQLAISLDAGRWAIITRPSESISAQATTSRRRFMGTARLQFLQMPH